MNQRGCVWFTYHALEPGQRGGSGSHYLTSYTHQGPILENFLNVPKQVQEGLPQVGVSLTLCIPREKSDRAPSAQMQLSYFVREKDKQIKIPYFYSLLTSMSFINCNFIN